MISSLFALCNFAISGLVIGNAFYQREQFYPSLIYISKSSPSMAVMYIQAFTCMVLLSKCLVKLFFGSLLQVEVEYAIEMAWFEAFDNGTAFIAFRDDFSRSFVAWFTLMYSLKMFHWMTEERINFMERSQHLSTLFHVRVLTFISILCSLDVYLLWHIYDLFFVSKTADSVQIVFAFQYAICFTMCVSMIVKYVLHMVDRRRESNWENKSVYLLYNEMIISFCRLTLCVFFVITMIKLYMMPLFAIRPLYQEYRTFRRSLSGVVLSRRAINIMNNLFPNATAEDLTNATDNICIICREVMQPETSKKLPCNHICHQMCLRTWFQRQQTCPICRINVIRGIQPPSAPTVPRVATIRRQGTTTTRVMQIEPARLNELINLAMQQMRNNNNEMSVGMFPVPKMPRPPPNFAGMTDEELKRIEGTERKHLEARLESLRNINVLLDAAALQMQQYVRTVDINVRAPSNTSSTREQTNTTDNTSEVRTETNISTAASAVDAQPTGARPKQARATDDNDLVEQNTQEQNVQ